MPGSRSVCYCPATGTTDRVYGQCLRSQRKRGLEFGQNRDTVGFASPLLHRELRGHPRCLRTQQTFCLTTSWSPEGRTHQTCTESEIRFVVITPLDVELEAVLAKRRRLNVGDDRKSASTTKWAVTDKSSARAHIAHTAGTSTWHTANSSGSSGGANTVCKAAEYCADRQTPRWWMTWVLVP